MTHCCYKILNGLRYQGKPFLSWGSFCGLKVDREDYKVTEFRRDKKYECSGHIINDSF